MFKGQPKRRYLVDKRYQLSQTLGLVATHLLVALCGVIMTAWFYLFIIDRRLIHNHNSALLNYLLVCAALLILLVVYAALRHSHRIAGVMFKLDMIFKNIGEGKYPEKPVGFRRRDYFHWLVPSLNRALDRCRGKEAALEDLYKEIEAVREEIANGKLCDTRMILDELQLLGRKETTSEGMTITKVPL
ncbi:MAG: hypothetical protein JXQ81_14320 [Desulfuromonadales bacterium]|nr:hypothetical protein [Desulfuromonadales bacterium]